MKRVTQPLSVLFLSALLSILWASAASAQTSDSLRVVCASGAVLSINLDDIAKITFDSVATEEVAEHEPLPSRFQPHFRLDENGKLTLAVDLAISGKLALDLFELTGKQVRHLEAAHVEAGEVRMEWSSKDKEGSSLPMGFYLYRVKVNDVTLAGKCVLVN